MIDQEAPNHRRVHLILFALIGVPIVVQIVVLAGFEDPRFFLKYWTLAEELADGEISTERLNDVSPLYLWFVTAAQALAVSPMALRIFQILLNGATSFLTASIALRLGGPVAAVTAAIAMVLNHALFINATELEPEALIVFLNAAALYFLFGRRLTARRAFSAGALFGLSATARMVALPAAVATGLAALWMAHREETPLIGRSFLSYFAGVASPILGALLVTFTLTGHVSIMNPGTVFYEGWNPHTTGYALTEPLIVSDVRSEIDAPDPLHIAYRLIAARITGEPASPELSNQFWTDKALDYIRTFPMEAAKLGLEKIFFSIHSYDAWDLDTMVARDRASDAVVWIPFGLLIGLASLALLERFREPAVAALALYSVSYLAILVAFYVTSRQRNAILPALTILAALSVASLVRRFAHDRRGALLRVTLVVLLAVLLTRTYHWQAENSYQWTASRNSEVVVRKMRQAETEGRQEEALRLRAIDRSWLLGDDPHIPAAPAPLVAAVALGELSAAEEPQRMFDLALALQYAGDWKMSDQILEFLDESGYQPIRQTKAVDSVSYYRALAALHEGRLAEAEALLRRASEQAPADSYLLALRFVLLDDVESRRLLFIVHDRLTAEMAVARAHYETGNIEAGLSKISRVSDEIPEWNRARLLRAYLTDLSASSGSPNTNSEPARRPRPQPIPD